jgi:Flp pilus assembly CpaF family ATPase
VIIEDLAELDLHEDIAAHPDAVSLEERDDNVEGTGRITMADLTRDALRMRPDRVIVGEVRGGEVLQMLLAMSQGNEGSLCTIHADSTATAFSRLQFYARLAPEKLDDELIKRLIATSVHLVVHIARRPDGARVVTSVRAVSGTTESGNIASDEIFASGPDGGSARPTGTPLMPDLRDRLVAAGFDPALLVTGWR